MVIWKVCRTKKRWIIKLYELIKLLVSQGKEHQLDLTLEEVTMYQKLKNEDIMKVYEKDLEILSNRITKLLKK